MGGWEEDDGGYRYIFRERCHGGNDALVSPAFMWQGTRREVFVAICVTRGPKVPSELTDWFPATKGGAESGGDIHSEKEATRGSHLSLM